MSMLLAKPSAGAAVAAPRRAAAAAPGARRCAARPLPFRRGALAPIAAAPQGTAAPTRDNEARWDAQVSEGKVKYLSGADLQKALADGWVLLDVRPPGQASKARIVGAVEVPIFREDESSSLSSLLARASAFGTGGWWLGGTHYVANDKFIDEVKARIPKDAKVVVACQKGLRSLAACEQLSLEGYGTLAWVNGGLDSCKKDEVPTVGDVDIRYAGIGGLSEAIGWTEVQQEEKKNIGSAQGVLAVVGAILVIDLLLFAGEYVQAFLGGGVPQ